MAFYKIKPLEILKSIKLISHQWNKKRRRSTKKVHCKEYRSNENQENDK